MLQGDKGGEKRPAGCRRHDHEEEDTYMKGVGGMTMRRRIHT